MINSQRISVSSARARRTVAVIAALGVAGLLAGCTSTAGGGAGAGDGGNGDVAFAGDKLSDAFVSVQVAQVEAAAKEADLPLTTTTNANGDVAKQITDVNTLLTQGISGLFIKPADSSAIVPAVESAHAKGVPVIAVSDAVAGGHVYITVQADNYEMGVQACETIGELVGGSGTVLNLQGDLASTNGKKRSDGFTDCMAEKFSGVTVVSKPTNWNADKAAAAAQTILTTQEIDGIYMASDTAMGAAVSQVLKNTNKWFKVGEEGHIATVTIDGGSVALADIRDGYQDALVSQPLNLFATYSVAYMKDALAGKKQSEGPTDHDSEIIVDEYDNLMDLIPAPLVTVDNVDDDTLWGNNS
jgi:ribose transport system substrate-binding protein